EQFGGYWVATRYADMLRIFKDPETFASSVNNVPPVGEDVFGERIPLNIDRPDHAVYRQILEPMFAPRVVERFEGVIRAKARDLLEPLVERGSCEFVRDFA